MRVVGTAGHVDHGKSTLVKKLTGIDPDRLAEEKAREMTIDLGFSWLKLPNGETVGLVDVPGHRDFIENMLAGIGGIDAVLLVIAADEGVMPQTREHLAILDLLGIQQGLIVLSKIDTVKDADWLELVENEIRETAANTTLAQANIVRVSARTGEGLSELVERMIALLATMPARPDYNHPRLPIDRIFTIGGFGTVVTGTLLTGHLSLGDEVEIQPAGLRGRIRGLQSYKEVVHVAEPGNRVAVNISGIEKKAIERGFVLTYPGQLRPTNLVDVRFRHLHDAERLMKHDMQVKFFAGASETVAHVRLLNDETIRPGAEGWLQIRLEKPLALAQGDRFILRLPSPSQTIGGGVVVNPHPERRWKRFQAEVIRALETRLLGTPAERIAQAAIEPSSRQLLQKQTGYNNQELETAIHKALELGLLVQLPDEMLLSSVRWQQLMLQMTDVLSSFHEAEPLRVGMSREELRSRMGLKNALLNVFLEHQDQVIAKNDLVRLATHQIRFSPSEAASIQELKFKINATPYTPLSFAEASQIVGEDVLRALMELGEIIRIGTDIIFSQAIYDEMVTVVLQIIDENGEITASALRDRFGTTRKYAIGLLEHLDAIGMTRRIGDVRVRGRNNHQ